MSQQELAVNTDTPIVDDLRWRQDLEYLNRLLDGRLTESQAQAYADTELVKHDGVVNAIETELAQVRALVASATTFLGVSDRKRIADKIELLEYQLTNARKLRERSIRLNGAAIRDGKEADKQRPRWLELKKRERAVEAARNIGRRK